MADTSTTERVLASIFTAVAVISIQLWLSIFGYFTFYYVYMPVEKFEQPVFLEYSSCKQFTGVESCPFPGSNITLRTDYSQNRVLMRGQRYDVVLEMDLPQSLVNQKQGVFMVELSLYSKHGEVTSRASRPMMLKYRSSLLRIFETLLYSPLFLFGYRDETQHLIVPLMEDYVDHPNKPVYGAYVEVRARQIEIYSAKFLIRAQFSGLRYLMFYWPLSSSFLGICFNFIIWSVITFLSWDQMWSYLFKDTAKGTGDHWKAPEDGGGYLDPFQIPEREERRVSKGDERRDLLQDLKSSKAGQQRTWASGRIDISYSDDDSDDDILLCTDLSGSNRRRDPGKISEANIKSGSSDSFETIEDSRDDPVSLETSDQAKGAEGNPPGARFRQGAKSSVD
ncbi:putative seipin isoform X1 [Apostichopus japonicus]|uniref:Seipin n=1 Tax=Stichopus japonicus TaxID=307972 RepID=A0A2G8LIS1_STIJA|nr:putative seipin isoform X1 [Apostichopus japonicus]